MSYKKSPILRPPYLKQITFSLDKVEKKDQYPYTLPLFSQDFSVRFTQPLTWLVGENGTGKSTLLELIANNCDFNLLGGSNSHFYSTQKREDFSFTDSLKKCLTFSWLPRVRNGFFMRAESFYNFLEYIFDPALAINPDYYGGELLKKSHGEAFLSFFQNRLNKPGIYLIDEPEAALSPKRQLEFLKILHEILQRGDSQFIIITHSPILMSYPHGELMHFSEGRIKSSHLDEVEHYQFVKEFVNQPEKFLKEFI